MQDFDGFTICLWLDEDGDWSAELADFPISMGHISAFSDTPENALAELRVVWDMMRDIYKERGEPIPDPIPGQEPPHYSLYEEVA